MNQLLKGFVLAGAVFGAVACGPAPTGGTEPQVPAEAPATDATASVEAMSCLYGGDWVCEKDGEWWDYYVGGKCSAIRTQMYTECTAYCGEPCVDHPVTQ